jgi:hypothetical protein
MADDLVVDLRGQRIETMDAFWDAVAGPCGLPDGFGRNVEAWRDAVQVRGVSETIDRHRAVVVHVDRSGLFAGKNREVRDLRWAFAGKRAQLVIHNVAD